MPPGGTTRQRMVSDTLSRRVSLCFVVVLASVVSVSAAAVAQEYPAELDEDNRIEAAPNQTLVGTADLEAGTEISVRLTASGGNPFLKQRQTTVGTNGTFEARFDLSGLEPGTEYTATVYSTDSDQLSGPLSGRLAEPGTAVSEVGLRTVTTVSQGETGNLSVSMPAGETVEVVVGDETTDYGVAVKLYDSDGDGEVVLRFDTAAAGTAEPTVAVSTGDGYEITRPEAALDGGLGPGEYPVTLYETLENEPVTLGRLVVENGTADSAGGDDASGPADESTAPGGASYADTWWYESVPAVAGLVALLSGLASLRFYRG